MRRNFFTQRKVEGVQSLSIVETEIYVFYTLGKLGDMGECRKLVLRLKISDDFIEWRSRHEELTATVSVSYIRHSVYL